MDMGIKTRSNIVIDKLKYDVYTYYWYSQQM